MAILTRISIGCGTGILAAGILLLSAESFFPSLTVVPGTMERRIPPALALIGGGLIGGVTAVSTFLLSKDGEGNALLSEGLRRGMGGEVGGGRMVIDPLTSTSIYIEDEEEEEETIGQSQERNTGEGEASTQIGIEWEVPTVQDLPISFPVDHPQTVTGKRIEPPKSPVVDHPQKAVSGTFSDLW